MTAVVICKGQDGRLEEINQALVRSLFSYDEDSGLLTRRITRSRNAVVGDVVGNKNTNGYLQVKINNKCYVVHRIIWMYVFGHWPADQIDHINRIKDDNRLVNLRPVSRSENMQNQLAHSGSKTGLKGVYRDKGEKKWLAKIRHNKKLFNLGTFSSPEEAVNAYAKAAREFHKFNPVRGEL